MNSDYKWVSDLGDGYYKNPILYADYSDPDVIRVGDDFYMTASSFNFVPGLPILHSKDLVNWEIINYAARRLQPRYDKPMPGCGVWAPSLRFHDGKYWIYYGDPDIGIMMTNTEDIYGEWSPVKCVKEGIGLIDPCPFWDEDGKAYIVPGYAKSRCGIHSKLAVFEMSADGTKAMSEDVIVFDGTAEHPIIEGPKFYKRNGCYYILAPAGGVATGWQTALRSKNIYGPYENKIVLHQGDTDINGPHQGGLTELENGECWFIHFQDLGTYGRIAHLQPARWIDDWPVIGEIKEDVLCGQPVHKYKKPNVCDNSHITPIPASDDFSGEKLGLQWQWQANYKEGWYSLDAKPKTLRLYSECVTDVQNGYMPNLPNVLTQMWRAPSMTITVKVEKGFGKCKAALGVAGLNYGYIALTDDGTVVFVKGQTEAEKINEYIVTSKKIDQTSVYLRTEVTGKENSTKAKVKCSYSIDRSNFITIGEFDASPGKWVGA